MKENKDIFQLKSYPKEYIKNFKFCSNIQTPKSLLNLDVNSSNSNSKYLNNIKKKNYDFDKNQIKYNENNSMFHSMPQMSLNENKIFKAYSKNSNYEKAKYFLKELNNQITKMNYCNVIQNNSIQRLDLSLSFLSSQINTLKFINKKRKMKLQKTIEKIKTNNIYEEGVTND